MYCQVHVLSSIENRVSNGLHTRSHMQRNFRNLMRNFRNLMHCVLMPDISRGNYCGINCAKFP